MNRSILIVICDFLLVSLLAFSTVDITKIAKPGGAPVLTLNQATNHVTGRQDLGEVMSLALQEERKNRDALLGELSRTRQTIGQREQEMQNVQNQLRAREEQTARLQTEETNLLGQFAAAQTNIENLNQQLHATTVESVISKEQRAAMEAEARKQADKERQLQSQLAELQRNNETIMAERGALSNQLQMSEASNRMAIGQMSQSRTKSMPNARKTPSWPKASRRSPPSRPIWRRKFAKTGPWLPMRFLTNLSPTGCWPVFTV
jgi:predicted RNase H-like nuclease (RuvC/YqgF family)